jgi:septum formation protein
MASSAASFNPVDFPPLILASSSSRRGELLAAAGYRFQVHPPTVDESALALHRMAAEELVCVLAYYKARSVADAVGGGLVLGADTVVECRGTILGKPADGQDARRMLRMLSGSEQRVLTGVALVDAASGRRVIGFEQTRLKMRDLTDDQIERYLAGGAGEGKAGAYALQAGGDELIEWMAGSESNVVGLPMEALGRLLGCFLAGEDHELHKLGR